MRRPRVGVALLALCLVGCAEVRENSHPVCEVRPPMILMAEAVPTAQLVPCVASLPVGWRFAGFTAEDGMATFMLDAEAGGEDALRVALTRRCDGRAPAGDSLPGEEPGTVASEQVRSEAPYEAVRVFRFRGGCATYEIRFLPDAPVDRLLADIERAISFIERGELQPGTTDDGLDPAGV